MNKFLTFVAALFLALPATAATPRQYKIEMKYFLDGKLVSSPAVVVNEGASAELSDMNSETGGGTFVNVTPKRSGENQVQLSFVLGKFVRGEKRVVGRPEIIALEGEEAAMEVSDRSRSGRISGGYRITALPTREN